MTVTVSRAGVVISKGKHVTVVACATGDSIVDQPIVRTTLAYLWQSERAGDWRNRRERFGYALYNPQTQEYTTWVDTVVNHGTSCSTTPYMPPTGTFPTGFIPIAVLHNHPLDPGIDQIPPGPCNNTNATAPPFPGLSPKDIQSASDGYSRYAIDRINIYGYDPNTKKFLKVPRDANGCTIIPPPELNRKPGYHPVLPPNAVSTL